MLTQDQWHKAYSAFRLLNIKKVDFHRNHFDKYCDGCAKPSIWHLYKEFRRIETQQQTVDASGKPSSATKVRSIGRGIQIAEAPLTDSPKVARDIPARRTAIKARLFSLTMADGSHIEFETPVPEQLALQMMFFSRGAR